MDDLSNIYISGSITLSVIFFIIFLFIFISHTYSFFFNNRQMMIIPVFINLILLIKLLFLLVVFLIPILLFYLQIMMVFLEFLVVVIILLVLIILVLNILNLVFLLLKHGLILLLTVNFSNIGVDQLQEWFMLLVVLVKIIKMVMIHHTHFNILLIVA